MSRPRSHTSEEDGRRIRKSRKRHLTSNFKIHDRDYYQRSSSIYETPVQLGNFSTDDKNRFCDDDRQLKHLSLPEPLINLNMDLKEGFADIVDTYEDEENSFQKLLRWIAIHKNENKIKDILPGRNSSKSGTTKKDSSKESVDFICTRQVLVSIFSTLYRHNPDQDPQRTPDWKIHATKFESVIYLCRIQTDEEKKKEPNKDKDKEPNNDKDDTIRKNIGAGYIFEKKVTSAAKASDPSRPANVNEQYYAVLKGKLDHHGIIFSAEMDAMDAEDSVPKSTSMDRFVEIKTNFQLNSNTREKRFKSKLLSWYLQCFLSGVPRLICGFRDEDYIVHNIEIYKVSDLPEMAENFFSPNACLNFGSKFLDHVKTNVTKDDPKVVYEFCWIPGGNVITCKVTEEAFLPEDYIKEMSDL